MFDFTNWIEVDMMYTDYCIECDEKGIEPLNRKEWYEKIYMNWE